MAVTGDTWPRGVNSASSSGVETSAMERDLSRGGQCNGLDYILSRPFVAPAAHIARCFKVSRKSSGARSRHNPNARHANRTVLSGRAPASSSHPLAAALGIMQ